MLLYFWGFFFVNVELDLLFLIGGTGKNLATKISFNVNVKRLTVRPQLDNLSIIDNSYGPAACTQTLGTRQDFHDQVLPRDKGAEHTGPEITVSNKMRIQVINV